MMFTIRKKLVEVLILHVTQLDFLKYKFFSSPNLSLTRALRVATINSDKNY